MPREKAGRVRTHISIDQQILMRLDLMFYDPARGRSAYGARSDFIERLLREHFAKEDAQVEAAEATAKSKETIANV